MAMCQLGNIQQLEHSTYFSPLSYGFIKTSIIILRKLGCNVVPCSIIT